MALTSESNSTIFAGEKMQRHLSYHFFSLRLTEDMNYHVTPYLTLPYLTLPYAAQNPPVPQLGRHSMVFTGVRVHYFFVSWLSVNSLSSPVNGSSEER
jgi:hypothetical protein